MKLSGGVWMQAPPDVFLLRLYEAAAWGHYSGVRATGEMRWSTTGERESDTPFAWAPSSNAEQCHGHE